MGSLDYIPGWKWGTWCLMNVSILLRDNHGLEGLSKKIWTFESVLMWVLSLVTIQKPIVKSGNIPKFSQFLNGHWDQFDVQLQHQVSMDHWFVPPFSFSFVPFFPCTSPPLSTLGNGSLWNYYPSLTGSVNKIFAKTLILVIFKLTTYMRVYIYMCIYRYLYMSWGIKKSSYVRKIRNVKSFLKVYMLNPLTSCSSCKLAHAQHSYTFKRPLTMCDLRLVHSVN